MWPERDLGIVKIALSLLLIFLSTVGKDTCLGQSTGDYVTTQFSKTLRSAPDSENRVGKISPGDTAVVKDQVGYDVFIDTGDQSGWLNESWVVKVERPRTSKVSNKASTTGTSQSIDNAQNVRSTSTALFSGSTQSSETWEEWINRAEDARKLYTTGDLNLRAGPSTRHRVLTTMPLENEVWIDSCEDGWCHLFYVSESGETGFVGYASKSWIGTRTEALREANSRLLESFKRGYPNHGDSHSNPSRGEGYINTDGDWVPSPRRSNDGPPAGATALCHDGTYSFSRNRRGTCSHHGGVARWLP